MRKLFFLLLVCIGISCRHEGTDYVDGVIVFDNTEDYPELNLMLSDVADVTYVPLKGVGKGFLIERLLYNGAGVSIDNGEIYITQERQGRVYVFDMAGNPLRKFDRRGRGPEEYGDAITNSWVDQRRGSIYVKGMGPNVYEYDNRTFEFKGSSPMDIPVYFFHSIVPLNDEYVVAHNKYTHDSELPTFYLIPRSDWSNFKHLPITLKRPYVHDTEGYMEHPSIIQGRDGLWLCSLRSDTIHWIDRQTMKISPRMVDKTDYPNRDKSGGDIMAVPSFETDRYVFFSIMFSDVVHPDMEMRTFVFDKNRKKIFRLPKPRSPWVGSWKGLPLPLACDECFLSGWNTTLTDGYGVEAFQPIYLLDNKASLPNVLKRITSTLDENDNPVLMIMKFK